MQNEVRLIDANALARWLDKEHHVDKPTGKCDERQNQVLGIAISALKNPQIAPTIDAVPFRVVAGVCKHGHIACVDRDNSVYDRVCRKNNPYSWDTCSQETCPLIHEKEGDHATD